MTIPWIDIAGWFGAALLLAAYALVSVRRLAAEGALFQGMNLAGGAGLAANSAAAGAAPSVAVNLIWIAIGVVALLRLRRRSRSA